MESAREPAREAAWKDWLRRVRHDLVKRLVWPARDRLDDPVGGQAQAGELLAALIDEEGNPASAEAVWAGLREDAPAPGHPALAAFAIALGRAVAAAEQDDAAGVLALESAFDRLVEQLAQDLAGAGA